MTASLAPGAIFAGYRIEALLGRGGMGVVYRAADLSLQRPVALKLIAPELAEDDRFRRRFLKESRLAASLDHASVVPIYEAGEHRGQLYLVMRYVEGRDLKTVLRRDGSLRPEVALSILGQIAAALDAAHRRGLVHRDVKPGNVLLDDDGHAYLTDFGVTKQLGGDSTDTEQLVGTLDYLAPEQIRGQAVDARTDVYALACVLYQCLEGSPPFHRETEAETLWAHMHDPPAPLPHRPALNRVLQTGLAKERRERYGSCTELMERARQSLGVGFPLTATRVGLRLLPRRRVILAAGLLALAAALAAGVVGALTGGGDPRPPPAGNGIAAIDSATGRVASFTRAGTAPSNIAVGDDAVWVLNTEDRSISRIEPRTKLVVRTVKTRGRPSDIAAGAGALWVGISGGNSPYYTAAVARVDPATGKTTHTEPLPLGSEAERGPSVGFPHITVGAGAVWVVNPQASISRLDPRTGRRTATIDTGVVPTTVAAGKEGVWFVSYSSHSVMRIDPRTGRITEKIPIQTEALEAVAVGAGAVWVTSPEDGLLWRIKPGPSPLERSIDVGVGVRYVAFGAGSVWTGNFSDGTVSRIDPRTNAVTAKVRVGAPQALAAGAGAGWASVAAPAKNGSLPASTCSEVDSGGARPDVVIASDLPLQGPYGEDKRRLVDTIRFVLKDHGFRAGAYTVGYQSCDDSTAQTGEMEPRKCAANARAYAQAKTIVALIGPLESYCAKAQLAIINGAPGGPLGAISPSASKPNLTRGGRLADPGWGMNQPQVYYPSGVHSFVRLIARDDLEGTAQAMLAKQLRLASVYLLYDPDIHGDVAWTDPFRMAASRLGVHVAGSVAYDPRATSYRALADRIARSHVDGVLIGGWRSSGGARLLTALRGRLGAQVTIMAGSWMGDDIPDLLRRSGRAARGLYLANTKLPPTAIRLTPAAKRYVHDFGTAANGEFALQTAQATEAVLQAIAHSNGTRATVLRALRATKVSDGILGSFHIDRYGDITPARVTIFRVTGHSPAKLAVDHWIRGAVVDRVETVPASLGG
jgi:ABC-type branched-subunit amino acid transport system substrate-binding protein/streptogramin lyase